MITIVLFFVVNCPRSVVCLELYSNHFEPTRRDKTMHVATKPYKQISTIVTAHHSYVAFEFHFRNIKAFSMAKCKM